ncbi:hypothetical protein FE782_12810 [Paenibacillus antri]|uniref:Uncharacterized protein n=2 Tax=Paenibacillus antri TaxID=2582848 RepID=A0A5R9G9M0_9BACL|nr:hypothetical protein FE782_12810 [Paenibacillus antri]
MGGIDGVLNNVTKIQKIMSSVQQMAPMLKLVMGSIGKSKSASSNDDDTYYELPRRRRRRRRRSGSSRRPSGRGRRR